MQQVALLYSYFDIAAPFAKMFPANPVLLHPAGSNHMHLVSFCCFLFVVGRVKLDEVESGVFGGCPAAMQRLFEHVLLA